MDRQGLPNVPMEREKIQVYRATHQISPWGWKIRTIP